MILPWRSISIFSAAVCFGKPGMVMMSPVMQTEPAPAEMRTSRTWIVKPLGLPGLRRIVTQRILRFGHADRCLVEPQRRQFLDCSGRRRAVAHTIGPVDFPGNEAIFSLIAWVSS